MMKKNENEPVVLELLVRRDNHLQDYRRIHCLRKDVGVIRYKIMVKDGDIVGSQVSNSITSNYIKI